MRFTGGIWNNELVAEESAATWSQQGISGDERVVTRSSEMQHVEKNVLIRTWTASLFMPILRHFW